MEFARLSFSLHPSLMVMVLFLSPVVEPFSWQDTVDLPFRQDAPRHLSELVKYGIFHQYF